MAKFKIEVKRVIKSEHEVEASSWEEAMENFITNNPWLSERSESSNRVKIFRDHGDGGLEWKDTVWLPPREW